MPTLEQQLDSLNLDDKLNPQAWELLLGAKETRADSFKQVDQDNDAIANQIKDAIGNDWEALAALYYQMGKHTKTKRLQLYGFAVTLALSAIGAAALQVSVEGVTGILVVGAVTLQFIGSRILHSNDRKDVILDLVERKLKASKGAVTHQ